MKRIDRRTFVRNASLTAGIAIAGSAESASRKPLTDKAPSTGKVIDTHMHLWCYDRRPFKVRQDIVEKYLRVQDENFVSYGINIGISGDELFYNVMDIMKPYRNRLGVMYSFDWSLIKTDRDFFAKAPDILEKAVEGGAIGLKCFKSFGLTVQDRDGSLMKIDDPRLFPVWERAGKLNIVVAFHTADPVAFFAPWNSKNERWKELELHPNWSFADQSKFPLRDVLLEQRDNVIRSFPGTKFQGCHVANNSEDIDRLTERFDELPNFYADISARVGELGRHPADKGRAFFMKYIDRLMFGTDHVFSTGGTVQGAGPRKDFISAEDRKFYETHWRYFQTNDRQFDHPTPIQGDWKIDGIGLDRKTLKKLYWDNAYKLFRLDRFGV